MKLLRRHSSKGSSHVDVLLHIEDLGPWPAQHGTLAVQFLRGKRAGQTKGRLPDDEDTAIASYTFDETLTVPATLYRSSFGEKGGYEEKKLSIFIAQVDDKGKELNVLGGLELNLADFADIQGHGSLRQSYPIECSSAIWKPAGGRPKLTMSIAVTRGGEKAAAELKAELSGPLAPVDEIPSTLSTDVEDESTLTTSPEAQGSVDGGGFDIDDEIIGVNNNSTSKYQGVSTSTIDISGLLGGGGAATTAPAGSVTTITVPAPPAVAVSSVAKSESLRYDSDGFLIDSELSESRQSRSEATTTNASHLNTDNNTAAGAGEATRTAAIFQKQEQSADSGTVVKRNLNKDLAEANNGDISPLHATNTSVGANGGVASAASGTVIKKTLTPGVDQPSSSSPGSIDLPQQPMHTRRFSRGDGAALGSRKWAWRRQSNDPALGDGAGAGGDVDGEGGVNSPSSPVLLAGNIRSASAGGGASYISGTSGMDGTAAATGAATGAAAVAKTSYGTPDTGALLVGGGSAGLSPSIVAGGSRSPSITAPLYRELQFSAALESAIFLAGRGWSSFSSSSHNNRQPKVEQLQAPARRLARTIIILGPEEGTAFGQRAVSAIRAAAAASLNDPQRLLLWWANAVTLRWSFWALGRGGGGSGDGNLVSPGGSGSGGGGNSAVCGGSHFDWLTRSLSPALRHLEAQMYSDLINYLWKGVLVPTAVQSASEAAALKEKNTGSDGNSHLTSTAESIMRTLSNGNSSTSRNTGTTNTISTAEGAMDHWIRALRAVDAALTPAGRPPAAPRPLLSLLRRHVMTGILTRLDGALLDVLLSDNNGNAIKTGTTSELENISRPELIPISRCSASSSSMNSIITNTSKGSGAGSRVTTSFDFISGVELKMAAGRLVEYASTEIAIREGPTPHASSSAPATTAVAMNGTSSTSTSTAPGIGPQHIIRIATRIKEVADLLMTPKSSLGDEEVRRTVAPSLHPGILVQVLQKYHPDDADVSADDKLPPARIKQLRVEAATTTTTASGAYGGGSRSANNNRGFHNNNNTFDEVSVYVPPVEEVLLEEGLIQPLSLETSADSDDELAVLEERGDVRYSLLRELWGAVRAQPI